MKITLLKMKLENFKSVKEKTIDFSARTNIKGQNAAGKTTVADAFMWVLFNKMSDGTQPDKIRPHDEDGKETTIKKIQKQKWTTHFMLLFCFYPCAFAKAQAGEEKD